MGYQWDSLCAWGWRRGGLYCLNPLDPVIMVLIFGPLLDDMHDYLAVIYQRVLSLGAKYYAVELFVNFKTVEDY